MDTKFSICIPNYNYAQYIGETIESVLKQTYQNFEICIADNASTDNSWQIIESYANKDNRINAVKNKKNVGFAGNLDKVASLAKGEWMIMLSSDDVMYPTALEKYIEIIEAAEKHQFYSVVVTSTFEKIDAEGKFLTYLDADGSSIWKTVIKHPVLSNLTATDIRLLPNNDLLHSCLLKFNNPYNFAATAYKRSHYEAVGGYEGSRMMNPDKWFHWKLLEHTEHSVFVNVPLFKYRWHQTNQTAQLATSGALKFWMDEYRNCFETTQQMLEKSKLTKSELEQAFITNGMKYVLLHIKNKEFKDAKRLYNFLKAAYPDTAKTNRFAKYGKIGLMSAPISALLINKLAK